MTGGELRVRVTPRAARDELVGESDGIVHVRVTAPPAEGRANDAVCALIARCIGLRAAKVRIVRGARARVKLVRYEGVEPLEAARRIREALERSA